VARLMLPPVEEDTGHPPLPVQLFRFVLTGGLSAIVDFGILVLLMHAGLGHTPAKAISFICGTTTAYLINRRWTFRAGPSARRFLGVVILYGATFFVQVGLFAVLFSVLTGRGLPLIWIQVIAFVIAQGVATTVNFIVQRLVIFRHRPHQGVGLPAADRPDTAKDAEQLPKGPPDA
jgi:putative flippase GtrA